MATEEICECGNGLYELEERESGKCRKCLGLFNPDVPRPTGEIDVRGEIDEQLK